jgi:hypothetical protein
MRRYCTRCQPNRVDTQEHCLFACGCPELVSARNNLFAALEVGGGPSRVGDLFDGPERTVSQLRQVVRFVAYCRRHVMSVNAGAPVGGAQEGAGEGEGQQPGEAEGLPAGEPAEPEAGPGEEGPGLAGELSGEGWEFATDGEEEGSELVEVVAPAAPGLVDYAQRPEDQPDLWGGLFGPEEEESLGIVQG